MTASDADSDTDTKITKSGSGPNCPSLASSPRVSKEFNDQDADVELVSSDGVIHRMHSYYLMAASPVYRTILVACKPGDDGKKRIELVDPDFETSKHMRDFLDLIVQKEVDLEPALGDFRRIDCLARLLIKYDCAYPSDLILAQLRLLVRTPKCNAFNVFMAGAMLRDPEICRDAIPLAGTRRWIGDTQVELEFSNQHIVGASVLDVSAMSDYTRRRIPEDYLMALLRACRLRGTTEGTKGDWNAVAKEFYTDYSVWSIVLVSILETAALFRDKSLGS